MYSDRYCNVYALLWNYAGLLCMLLYLASQLAVLHEEASICYRRKSCDNRAR